MSIQDTLDEREKQHGSFETHAEIEMALTGIFMEHMPDDISDVQVTGMRMILHKISRILNNGHNHIDSWHDIAGYATLVEQHMTKHIPCPDCGTVGHAIDCLHLKS